MCIFVFRVLQTLHEEKTSHEKDMCNVRVQYEEEVRQMKEGQTRALEDVGKKHRVTLENALSSTERDKNRLLAVSTRITDIHSNPAGHYHPYTFHKHIHKNKEALQ